MELPFEILALVFRYLPAKDLDTVQLVCRSWYDIAGDKVWKEQFWDKFGTDRICPVSPKFTSWRRELLIRTQLLQKWKKCSKKTDITLNSTLTDNTEMYCNFSSDLARAVCFNSHTGFGNIVELDRGKIKRKIYASRYGREMLPVSATGGSRFGMVYGFLDGIVTTVEFSRDGSVVGENRDQPYRHESAVTSVWIAQSRHFTKPANHAISVASGGFDGTISLRSPRGHQELKLESSPVHIIEGSMGGSNASEDGDTLVVLFKNGALYHVRSSGEKAEASLLARISVENGETDSDCQLHMCNNYAILQTDNGLYATDLLTKQLSQMHLPESSKITAFAIDTSRASGTKLMAAGLASNEICVWQLPALESPEAGDGQSPRIELVKRGTPSKASKATGTSDCAKVHISAAAATSPEERQLSTKPLWTITNPIGYESRLSEGNKPQITKLAMNSAILLIGGYNGMVYAVDALSGKPLKRISSRISKSVLDLSRYSRDGFVPVTHLQIDPDPLKPRALISVRPAVQFLDLGSLNPSKVSLQKKKSPRPRRRSANVMTRHDIEEDIELGDYLVQVDAEREDRNSELVESFGVEGMGQEEQLAYAMLLSNQEQEAPPGNAHEELDEDLRRALELSALDDPYDYDYLTAEAAALMADWDEGLYEDDF